MSKQISPSKYWFFTAKYTAPCNMHKQLRTSAARFAFQEEIGDSGFHHLQGVVEFKTRLRPLSLGLDSTIHWEKMKGKWEEALAYCTKDETSVPGGYKQFLNCRPRQTLRIIDSLRPWQQTLVDGIVSSDGSIKQADDRTIQWWHEATGNMGKTALTKYLVHHHGAIILSGKGADVFHGVAKFIEEKGYYPELIVYDIPRSIDMQYISFSALEGVKNGLFFSGKYETATCIGNSPHLIVFSNDQPPIEKLSGDRWKIHHIMNL